MTWTEAVLAALSSQGLRMTGPRLTIVQHIAQRIEPFTAEQLVADLHTIGRATIYRTLDVLAAGHWLARIHRAEGEHAYVPAEPHKHSLVCTKCGTSVTFESCDLDGVLNQLGQRTGFTIQGHTLEAFGLCTNCQ